MKTTPKTDEQLEKERGQLEPGEYDFTIDSAHAKTSKKGNEMIELGLTIFTSDGESRLRDYLLDSMGFKLKHFAYAVGVGQAYENGGIDPSELTGRSGKVVLRMGKARDGYPARIEVKDYCQVEAPAPASPNAAPRVPAPAPADDTNSPPF